MQPATAAVEAEHPATDVAMTQRDPTVAGDSSASPQAASGTQGSAAGQTPGRSGPTAAPSDEGKQVMTLNDLPPSIRREMPGIAIMFHAYSSDPAERRVMINGNMAKEGETLADGLGLQQITPDGVILLYKGYRFRHAVR